MPNETTAQRADAVTQVLNATQGESESVKVAAVEAAAGFPRPTQEADIGWIWKALVVGLLVLIGIALGGVLWAVLDGDAKTDGDKALIVFTPLLTGLLGLFVTSPADAGKK
jgi:hypothetical protein